MEKLTHKYPPKLLSADPEKGVLKEYE